jgi:hypothetical protein
MPIIQCAKALRQCLPCNDDPLANISAEDVDTDRYIGILPQYPDQPLTGDPNKIFFSFGCLGICYSTQSQADADICATNQALECVGDSPGGTTTNGDPRFIYSSDAKSCSVACPDGGTFTFTLPAGSVISFYSTSDANARAEALACKLAKTFKLCLSVTGDTSGCKDSFMSFVVSVTGLLSQHPYPSQWTVQGPAIHPGILSYDLDDTLGTTSIRVFGTPIIATNTNVSVKITDLNTMLYMERTIPISIGAIAETSPLASGTEGVAYTETILLDNFSLPVFSIASGSLPTGLSLNASTGQITGTPASGSSGVYTINVTVTDLA